MAKDILKEAIADAKAVREVALANAKAALEEAFTPKLQNMLSAKLSEDLDEEMYDEDKEDMKETYMDEEMDEDMDETYMDEEMDEDMDEDMDEVKHGDDDVKEANLDEEIDLEEILNELELEEVDDSKNEEIDEAKKDDDDKVEEAKDDKEEKLDENRPVYKSEDANYAGYTADRVHEGDGEFDLDALLEEINNLDEKKEDDEVNESEEVVNETEDTNEVVGTALAGIGGLVAAAGGVAKLKMAAEDPAFKEKYPKIASMLDKLQDMGAAAGSAMRRENEEMAEELEETKKALETVSKELNEVNLLNSKLLYVNRIFKANTLDESQKLRVVESLDKASSTKEAKLIYETIKDTFNISKNTKSSSKRKSIKENLGMASKATGTSTAPKKEVISESNDMVARFKKLANIKINE